MKNTLNPHQNLQSLHDCPFPLLDPKKSHVQLVDCRITGKVSVFCKHDCTYCTSIRTDNSNRANNSSSSLLNSIKKNNSSPVLALYITGLHHWCSYHGTLWPFWSSYALRSKVSRRPLKTTNKQFRFFTDLEYLTSTYQYQTCLPLVQNLLEFLEILVHLYHPMPEFSKQSEKMEFSKRSFEL